MKKSKRTVLLGAVMGGVLGALLGALVASRNSGDRGTRRPSAAEATAIGVSMLGVIKQIIDAFT